MVFDYGSRPTRRRGSGPTGACPLPTDPRPGHHPFRRRPSGRSVRCSDWPPPPFSSC